VDESVLAEQRGLRTKVSHAVLFTTASEHVVLDEQELASDDVQPIKY
jgi:hypothetical protein